MSLPGGNPPEKSQQNNSAAMTHTGLSANVVLARFVKSDIVPFMRAFFIVGLLKNCHVVIKYLDTMTTLLWK